MLEVDCSTTASSEMSIQYLGKADPASYGQRLTHEYLQPADPTHQSLDTKVQQHSINDILGSSKQGKRHPPLSPTSLKPYSIAGLSFVNREMCKKWR